MMKKKLLFTVFSFLGFVSVASAQISFGPKLGAGLSTIREVKRPESQANQGATDYSYIIVPQIGVVLNAQFGDYLALRPELLYTQRGCTLESNTIFFGDTYTYKGTIRASYIELPIHVVGSLPAGPGQVEVFAGPSFGYVLGGNAKTEFISPSGTENDESNIIGGKQPADYNDPGNGNDDVYLNPFNVSLNFGAGYKFNNGLLIQLGYNLGLSNMIAHSEDSDTEEERKDNVIKSNTFTLGVAYLFGGKK